MLTPFPGMDPYLEQPGLWPNVHNSLIVALRDDLAPRLRPRYHVAVEERTVSVGVGDLYLTTRPDVSVIAREPAPVGWPTLAEDRPIGLVVVEVPMPDEITETYLEIRTVEYDRVVTVIEILSPTNKVSHDGRQQYEQKRLNTLGTRTHLVEIDLLCDGAPMPTRGYDEPTAYRILVSRYEERPQALLLPFSIRQPIPSFRLPLEKGNEEPLIEMNNLLHALYDRAGYDLRIDYGREPEPPLSVIDRAWVDQRLQDAGLRT